MSDEAQAVAAEEASVRESVGKVAGGLAAAMELEAATPQVTPTDAPATPPAEPAAPEETKSEEQPRDEKGKFKSPVVAMREALKRQKDKNKALSERIAELEAKPAAPAVPASVGDVDDETIAGWPEETQKWWRDGGAQKVIDKRAAEIARAELEKHPGLAKADAMAQTDEADSAYQQAFDSWVEDRLIEHEEVVDQDRMIIALDEVEQKGWRFGKTDAEHFDHVLGILKKVSKGASAPVVKGDDAKAINDAAAAERASAGGVSPSSSYTPPPVNDLAEHQRALRDAGMAEDTGTKHKLLSKRMRGLKGLSHFFPGAPGEAGSE